MALSSITSDNQHFLYETINNTKLSSSYSSPIFRSLPQRRTSHISNTKTFWASSTYPIYNKILSTPYTTITNQPIWIFHRSFDMILIPTFETSNIYSLQFLCYTHPTLIFFKQIANLQPRVQHIVPSIKFWIPFHLQRIITTSLNFPTTYSWSQHNQFVLLSSR